VIAAWGAWTVPLPCGDGDLLHNGLAREAYYKDSQRRIIAAVGDALWLDTTGAALASYREHYPHWWTAPEGALA
jgi:hypothetical protein